MPEKERWALASHILMRVPQDLAGQETQGFHKGLRAVLSGMDEYADKLGIEDVREVLTQVMSAIELAR